MPDFRCNKGSFNFAHIHRVRVLLQIPSGQPVENNTAYARYMKDFLMHGPAVWTGSSASSSATN
ncbi:uncharacterized protein ANIA_11473 [Aspergillus nidulans FGSC A4]|uniref:Uncharacterized protein n=1 Tax=Emericella nidulans (strain FGSC A4 / ATCC 38163 / CBS 112.46 / NRRL 194 / M139) TaxID=227321 RepID=C8VH19_EMENI|nr:hypothetical protein [Aspergillus nidulans FGSC A4]CBF82208.1 TPA: hypothetical protein ANIA_11473 [Aspergillus nidulans FGSC A4]